MNGKGPIESSEGQSLSVTISEMTGHPGGVSQVWQAKDLREAVFGSVANKGVMGEILEVWQGKNLADF